MTTKLKIRAPCEEPAVYEFDVQDVEFCDDILYMDYNHHLYDAFNAHIDETSGMIDILGAKYHASEILKAVDETAYRCYFSDWLTYEVDYIVEALDSQGYATIGEIEITLISESEEEEE